MAYTVIWWTGQKIFFSTEVYLTHNVIVVLGVQRIDWTSLCSMLASTQMWLQSVTIQHYYNNTDCLPFAALFIHMTFSFHNWKPVSHAPLHPFCSLHHILPIGNHQVHLCIYRSGFAVCLLLCSLDATYKWITWYFSFSIWLISLSTIPSRSIHFVKMARSHSFFMGIIIYP